MSSNRAISQVLLNRKAITLADSPAERFADADWPWELLETAYPSVRNRV
jgi:hypothetical protein